MLYVLAALAVVIIVVLAIWAWRLQAEVRKREAERERQLQELEDKAREQRSRVNKSIQVIANSVLAEEQITLTEAAMRLSVLLESLGVDDDTREQMSALFKLAEATAHIPILQEWKKLSTKQKLAYDKQREQLEADYKDFIHQCCKNLRGREF